MALTIKKNVTIARKGSANTYGPLVKDVAEILVDLVDDGTNAVIPSEYNEDLYNDDTPTSDDDETPRGPSAYRLAVARTLKAALLGGQLGYDIEDAQCIALNVVFDIEGDIILRAKHDPDLPAKREARNEAAAATKAGNAEDEAPVAKKATRKAKKAPVEDDDEDEAPAPRKRRKAKR